MDYNTWINKIFLLKIKPDIKNYLTNLMKIKSKPNFVQVDNSKLNMALTNIGGHHDIILTFDIEFQTALLDDDKFTSDKKFKNMNAISFCQEFGMIIFLRDYTNTWYFVGSFMINFQNVSKYNISPKFIKMTMSTYMSVSSTNEKLLKQNESKIIISNQIDKIFNDIKYLNSVKKFIINHELFINILSDESQQQVIMLFDKVSNGININFNLNKIKKILDQINYNLYENFVSKKYKDIIVEQKRIYHNDKNVIDRTLTNNEEKYFMENFKNILDYSYIVVKGQRDMSALHNTYKLIFNVKKSKLNFSHFYNIEIFNQLSQNIYGSAQLEKTFIGLSNDVIYKKNVRPFFRKLNITGKSHNPLIDSLYTLVVAIIVNMALNNYFVK